MNIIKQVICIVIVVHQVYGMEDFPKLGAEIEKWHEEVLIDLATRADEFQVSYKGRHIKLDGRSDLHLISTIPAIGFYRYGNMPYLFRGRCLLVQFNPLTSWNFLPRSVQDVLMSVRNVSGSSIRGAITMHGRLKYTKGDTIAEQTRLANILYHSWVGEVIGKVKNFNINIPMGIFEPNGVERYIPSKFVNIPKTYQKKRGGEDAGIPFGVLGLQNVHEHNAYSPDNARFVITSGRNIATFWSVAVYPENTHALVTFHILINGELEEKFVCDQAISNATTLKDILRRLYDIVLPTIGIEADKDALRTAIITVRNLVGGTYPAEQQTAPLLMDALKNLQRSLQHLRTMLV